MPHRCSRFLALASLCVTGWSCSSVPPVDHGLEYEMVALGTRPALLWSRKMPGLISDLNVARDSGTILVATLPNAEVVPGSPGYVVSLLDPTGTVQWTRQMGSQVKAQDISRDGSLAVVSTYQDETLGIGAKGDVLWKVDYACKPVILSPARRVVCFHDDDQEPEIAFKLYDWQGKRVDAFEVPFARQDALSLKVAEDERTSAISFTSGNAVIFDEGMTTRASLQVAGEIIDMGLSSSAEPRIAVLYRSSPLPATRPSYRVALFNSNGKLQSDSEAPPSVRQVELTPNGDALVFYGNGPGGQRVQWRDLLTSVSWSKENPRFADYPSQLTVTQESAMIGFEDDITRVKHMHLLAFNPAGQLLWNLPVETNEGAYVYTHAWSPQRSLVAIGTDDAILSVYQASPQAAAGR